MRRKANDEKEYKNLINELLEKEGELVDLKMKSLLK